MMKRAGVKPWLFVFISMAIFAGCHGGGGSSTLPTMQGSSSLPGLPRRAMSAPANPAPTITPTTVCAQTYAGNSYDKGTEYSCWVQGGATSQQLTAGPVEAIPGTNWQCRNKTYVFIDGGSDSDPPSPLPSPTVVFNPAQGTNGSCEMQDSTQITFTFPSPIPQSRWADRWIVAENFQYNGGDGVWHGNSQQIAEFWLHPGLRILDNDNSGSEIQNQTWERVVGQRVNIAADKPWGNETISGCSWNVPNGVTPYAVGGYPTFPPSPSPSVQPSPAPMPTTSATSLTYYWAQPFDASQQNVTCSVSATNFGGNGEGGYAVPATSISAILNPHVVAPSFSISQVMGSITLGAYYTNGTGEEISYGTQLDMPSSLGIQSSYSVTMPTDYGGDWGPNQIGKWTTTVSPQPSPTPPNSGGAFVLDNCTIYSQTWDGTDIVGPQAVPSAGPGGQASFTTVDAPNSGDWSMSSMFRETDDFITTLMFKPTTGPGGTTLSNTIWVPLAEFTWGYDGEAVNNSGWAWASSPAPTQYPATGTYTYASNPTVFTSPPNFPSWQSRYYDQNINCDTVP